MFCKLTGSNNRLVFKSYNDAIHFLDKLLTLTHRLGTISVAEVKRLIFEEIEDSTKVFNNTSISTNDKVTNNVRDFEEYIGWRWPIRYFSIEIGTLYTFVNLSLPKPLDIGNK